MPHHPEVFGIRDRGQAPPLRARAPARAHTMEQVVREAFAGSWGRAPRSASKTSFTTSVGWSRSNG